MLHLYQSYHFICNLRTPVSKDCFDSIFLSINWSPFAFFVLTPLGCLQIPLIQFYEYPYLRKWWLKPCISTPYSPPHATITHNAAWTQSTPFPHCCHSTTTSVGWVIEAIAQEQKRLLMTKTKPNRHWCKLSLALLQPNVSLLSPCRYVYWILYRKHNHTIVAQFGLKYTLPPILYIQALWQRRALIC